MLDVSSQQEQARPLVTAPEAKVDTHVFPLSFAQQRLWFLDRIAPGNPFYNIPLAIPVRSRLRVDVLQRVINTIADRHEALRTTFQIVDGSPAQIVHPHVAIPVGFEDLTKLAPNERESALLELATKEARQPFDLEAGPLIRCTVLQRGLFDYVILISMHHIVADGWSMGVLAKELSTLYQAFSAGSVDPLPPLPIQYPDFAVWQRDWLRGEVLEEQLAYWRCKLDGLPLLDLPSDRPRPAYATFSGAAKKVRIAPSVTASVRRIAKQHNATPFMVLLAAFAVLLGRHANQTDVVIGAPLANRIRPEIEELIGFFVNSLVLRIDLGGDPSFAELIGRVRQVAIEAYSYQELPFEKIVEQLQPTRDPSRNPLFQVTFQLVNTPNLAQASGADDVSAVEANRGSAIFDLAFSLIDRPDAYAGIIEYSTDLFDASTIDRIERSFQRLLASALDDSNVPISRLPMLGDGDPPAVLQGTSAEPGRPLQMVHAAIAAQVERTPSPIAIQDGDAEVSYDLLHSRWRRLSHDLRENGVRPGDRVGVLLDRSADAVAAILAVLDAGAAYVPLDPEYPPERLRYAAGDAGLRVIVSTAAHLHLAEQLVDGSTQIVLADGRADRPGEEPELARPPVSVAGEDVAYVIYTSGSTGQPKGVAVPHRALSNHMAWMVDAIGATPETRILQRTALGFDASVWELFLPLMTGGRLVILPQAAYRDPEAIAQVCHDAKITDLQVVPSLLRLLLAVPAFYNCPTLKRIFAGGEQLGDDLRDTVVNKLGVELVNLYGPTEATIQAVVFEADERPWSPSVPIGRPIAGTRAYVLDGHHEPVPVGVPGELYLGGACVAQGYVNRPAATADRFLPDPIAAEPGARMYRTGDRARLLASGDLQFIERTDRQIKLRGFRIELGEIESRIRQIPGIADCAVLTAGPSDHPTSLAAFLIASSKPSAELAHDAHEGSLDEQQVSQWIAVYDAIYGELDRSQPASFNITGWNSSYTGLPLAPDEMRRWQASTVSRILQLEPDEVLEIGCGTGLLLTQIAPGCSRYVATDVSAPVIAYLTDWVAEQPELSQVQLQERAAHELDDLPDQAFDTVILNSVVQYFPSGEYLTDMLTKAVAKVRNGGAVFVGDVRSLPLLEAFHLSVALSGASGSTTAGEILRRLRLGIEQEKELVLDPGFFHRFAEADGRVRGIEVAIKEGRDDNELVRFRYDVTIHIGEPRPVGDIERHDWGSERLTLDLVGDRLATRMPDHLVLLNIPNRRVVDEVRLLERVTSAAADVTLDALRSSGQPATEEALDPDAFFELAPSPYRIRIRFSEAGADCFDVLMSRRACPPLLDEPSQGIFDARARDYSNDPLRGARARRLIPAVRDQLSISLPEHMLPSALVLIDEMPLLTNGKRDEAKLRQRLMFRVEAHAAVVPPRTPLEKALALLWGEVLGVSEISIHDDFFADHGGHSLLATQLIVRVRETLDVDPPLRLLFMAPTLEQFAASLEQHEAERLAELVQHAELYVSISQMTDAEVEKMLAPAGAGR